MQTIFFLVKETDEISFWCVLYVKLVLLGLCFFLFQLLQNVAEILVLIFIPA